MSYYYPQAAMILRVLWEDFDLKSNAALQEVYTLPVLAKSLNVKINDYTKADEFRASLDFKNFPFDPRTVRSLGVSIYMQNMKSVFRTDNSLNLLKPSSDNVIFQGFADTESIELSESNRMVTFEGRDFTSLLIDAPFDQKDPLTLNKPVDEIISDLIQGLEATQKIQVVNRAGELPVLSKFASQLNKLSGRNRRKKESYWDVITDLAQKAGVIAYIEIDKLILTKPRNIYSSNQQVYSFVYGRNLKNLNFERKLGRKKGFNIRVRSLNTEKKEVIEALIPEEATSDWLKSIGITAERVKKEKIGTNGEKIEEDAPFLTFNVPDINSKDHLVDIGQGVFEEVGRQQIEGSFESHEMNIGEIKNGETSILNNLSIRNGTPVKVEIEQGDLEQMNRLKSPAERSRYLKSKCYSPSVADALAESWGKFDPKFYTRSVEFMMDKESGFKVHVDFVNFIDLKNKGL